MFFVETVDVGCQFVYGPMNRIHASYSRKSRGRKSTFEEINDSIRNHIKSFPVMDSHFCRKSIAYSSLDLLVNKMYTVYCMGYNAGNNIPTKCSYRKMFNQEFNLGFYRPKKKISAIDVAHFKAMSIPQRRNQNSRPTYHG